MEKRFEQLEKVVNEIKDNHLVHISIDLAELKTNQSWLLRYHWMLMTASVGALVASLANLVLK